MSDRRDDLGYVPAVDGEATLWGWGRLAVPGAERWSEDLEAASQDVVLTRGLGRAYGDAALPPPGVQEVLASPRADRILELDTETGRLTGEAGLSLWELNRLLLPRGWFVPVSPGTQYVTLGGMVAADVHGKNHHQAGTFGAHVEKLLLRVASGELVACGPQEENELFWATVGGMGLTGHILQVSLRMERVASPWIAFESERFAGLDELVSALRDRGREWPFTAAWLDCLPGGRRLGRGTLLCGRWAAPDEAPPRPPAVKSGHRVPFAAPSWLLNRASVGLFNRVYYWKHQPRRRRGIVHPATFFYPLDVLQDWNRLYGRRGMTQYQCVLPATAGVAEVGRFLAAMQELGGYPFLVVLKDFGAEGQGLLSFPCPGHTLALDFPVGGGTVDLVAGLNRRLLDLGGRVYLAKDAFTRRDDYQAMEGERLARWQAVRYKWDPERRFRSHLSNRLLDD